MALQCRMRTQISCGIPSGPDLPKGDELILQSDLCRPRSQICRVRCSSCQCIACVSAFLVNDSLNLLLSNGYKDVRTLVPSKVKDNFTPQIDIMTADLPLNE